MRKVQNRKSWKGFGKGSKMGMECTMLIVGMQVFITYIKICIFGAVVAGCEGGKIADECRQGVGNQSHGEKKKC